MWILIQSNKDKTRVKYLASRDYDVIIDYIHRFSNVKKYSDYLWKVQGGEINFDIMLGEELNNEKTEKKKSFNKEIRKKHYQYTRENYKKVS